MQTLVLLSELTCNKELEIRLKGLFTEKPYKLGYIPSSSDKEKKYFNAGKLFFESMGVENVYYFDIDDDYDSSLLEELYNCDGIYLSGGNTFYFLKNLQERNMLEFIRSFVREGKHIIGVSAGSIILSDTISIAKYLDENIVGLENLEGLGLVDFKVLPHWGNQISTLDIQQGEQIVYMLRDGEGIVVTDNQIEFYCEEKR